MARATPRVWVLWWGGETRAEVHLTEQEECSIRLDTPAWQTWLEAPTTRSFAYPLYDRQLGYIRGFVTVRKERRSRGSHYWVAYRRTAGRLRKLYLGGSAQLTHQHLAASAQRFLVMEGRTSEAMSAANAQEEVKQCK